MKKVTRYDIPRRPRRDTVYVILPKKFSKRYYRKRTDRNIGWITDDEQMNILHPSVVGIAGCGGMGGLLAATLVRSGIGEVRIADNEVFDVSNLNRQFGATQKTLGKSKAFETARKLRRITSDTTLVIYPKGICKESARDFVSGCDVVCDEIEFWALGARVLLHTAMRKANGTILCTPTVGHSTFITRYTADSMKVETLLEMTYKRAAALQQKISTRTINKKDLAFVIKAAIRFAAPKIPEYSKDVTLFSTVRSVMERLKTEFTASIIGTNPPMATGFLANNVLFFLLKRSPIKRVFTDVPLMPGYRMFDAGLGIFETRKTKWW